MNIDRIKIAVELEDVQELRHGALKYVWNGQKYPTDIPVFSYRKSWEVLIVDVSVPRSLFKNTLEESTAEDMDKIVAHIQKYAYERGLYIPAEAILNAEVWYLELGKNIILDSKRSLYNCLLKLGLCLVKRANYIGKTWYFTNEGNNGFKVCVRNEGREVCFYDKTTKELALRGGYNTENKKIFHKLLVDGHKVLRYEVKFYKSASVKSELKFFGSQRTFKDVWNASLVQDILTYYWEDIEETLPSVRVRKAGLIKSIQTAVQNGASCADIVSKIGFDYLEQKLGATTLKQLLMPCEAKIQGKTREVSYGTLRKKQQDIKAKFKTKREYVAQKISQYLTEMKPIRINQETGDIEGVL